MEGEAKQMYLAMLSVVDEWITRKDQESGEENRINRGNPASVQLRTILVKILYRYIGHFYTHVERHSLKINTQIKKGNVRVT